MFLYQNKKQYICSPKIEKKKSNKILLTKKKE
jgi:hypothetical protein